MLVTNEQHLPPTPNLTRHAASQIATYWCGGYHARQRGLAHGVHCDENPGRVAAPRLAGVRAGPWDLEED